MQSTSESLFSTEQIKSKRYYRKVQKCILPSILGVITRGAHEKDSEMFCTAGTQRICGAMAP